MMLTLVPVLSHDQKSHGSPFFNYLDQRNAKVSLIMLLASCDVDASTNGVIWLKSNVSPHFDCLVLKPQWCHWWCCQHYMILMSVAVASHDQKSHVAPHFDCPDLMNAMVPLMLASHKTGTSGNGITWPKSHVAPQFDHLDLRNAMVALLMLSVSCDSDVSANGITWPK